jgi:hypothetical protein
VTLITAVETTQDQSVSPYKERFGERDWTRWARYARSMKRIGTLTLPMLLLAGATAAAQSDYGECASGGSRTLKLDVSVDPTIVVPTRSQEREPAAPHTSTIRVTLTNPGPQALRLTFPDPCFLGYRVETTGSEPALPAADGTVCAAELGQVRLEPGGRQSKSFRWTARTGEGTYTPLPPGKYRIVGTLQKRYCNGPGGQRQEEPPLETAPVLVEVRPAN